jgi:regulator of PEP synthase PpsR (kinase-PPPase family)
VFVLKKLYPDRGMMKWQGLIISEHTEMMEEERKKVVKEEIIFDEQQHEEFDRIVVASLHLRKKIVFQMNSFGDNHLLKVDGIVSECSRITGQKPNLKLEGSSSKFWIEEIVSIDFAVGDDDGDAR